MVEERKVSSVEEVDVMLQNALACYQVGSFSEAEEACRTLERRFPMCAHGWNYRGTVAFWRGDLLESVRCFERSLCMDPRQAIVLSNQGMGLHRLGRLDEALASYDRALQLRPTHAELHVRRANVLADLRRLLPALESVEQALRLDPDHAPAHGLRGSLLQDIGSLDEALRSYERALALAPHDLQIHNNRATALQAAMRPQEALAVYEYILQRAPDDVVAHLNRAMVLQDLQCFDEALAGFDRAVALQPARHQAHFYRGTALLRTNRLDEALVSFEHALALDPQSAQTQWNKALALLKAGEYSEGWRLFEWGWKSGQRGVPRHLAQPLWLGEEDIRGKTLLIHPEQGLGDFIQFCRYVPMLQTLGARLVLEVPTALLRLMATLQGDFTIVEQGARLPDFDVHCPIMSLPLALKTSLQTIPSQIPYLHADAQGSAVWQTRLGDKTRPRIGLVWSGGSAYKNDHLRSIPLELLAPLMDLPLEFHALQKEIRPDDAVVLRRVPTLFRHQHQLHDFADTAALIGLLDMVISVDTSVAHLAGAMGKPVWLLLPFVPDYRWMLERTDSPWYPSATLFRQPGMDDWQGLVVQVKGALGRFAME